MIASYGGADPDANDGEDGELLTDASLAELGLCWSCGEVVEGADRHGHCRDCRDDCEDCA